MDEWKKGGAGVDRWTTPSMLLLLLLQLQSSAELWPPGIHSHRHLTPVRGITKTQTQRRDFLSICYWLQSLPSTFVFVTDLFSFHWFCYEDFEWPVFPPPAKQPVNQTPDMHARTPTVAYLFTQSVVSVHVCAGGCNTAQRWHFNFTQQFGNRKKQSLEYPTSERARLWLTNIYINI